MTTPAGDLQCNLCKVLVKYDKKLFVEGHRKSKQHQEKLETMSKSQTKQTCLQLDQVNFKEQVVSSFFAADTPFYSDGFYMERAERSLQAPLQKCRKAAPPKKCREASTTKKCHKAAPPKKCRKEGRLKICSKCSPPQKCCEAALQKVPSYV